MYKMWAKIEFDLSLFIIGIYSHIIKYGDPVIVNKFNLWKNDNIESKS